MRTSLCVIAALGSSAAAALGAAAGCGSLPEDCAALLTCTSSSGAGGTSETPPECVPSNDPTKPVNGTCGVFVTSSEMGSDEANVGSKEMPLRTLAAAVAKVKKLGLRPIYACAETFTGPVTLDGSIELYGGLDCTAGWVYTGNRTTLTAAAGQIPLTVTKESREAKIADFAIVAETASKEGGSSIAVLIDQAKVTLSRCDITAGDGAGGIVGGTPSTEIGPLTSDDARIAGNRGVDACIQPSTTPGGAAKDNAACAPAGSLGGAGGFGEVDHGGEGKAQLEDAHTAQGGIGQPIANAWDCNTGRGAIGSAGAPGGPGMGARGDGILDVSGYKGVPGQSGGDGAPGKGGGGGGGAKGKSPTCFGASGGGGGVGGCGGQGGGGGSAGGASIGIISLGAPLTLDSVTIKVGDGGKGGDGGNGQFGVTGGDGGKGGNGTSGTLNGCPGGNGGRGGDGGNGGGGHGGHAIGIAVTGSAMPNIQGVSFTDGTPGTGGKGLDMMIGTDDGEDGIAAQVKSFM